MDRMALSEFKKYGKDSIISKLPFIITVEGIDTFVCGEEATTIDLTGLHPAMKAKIKNLERMGRKYVPAPEVLD